MGFRILAILTFFSFGFSVELEAQELIPEGTGVIDHLIQSESPPESAYILIENKLNKIQKIPAQTELLGKNNRRGTYILGAPLPIVENKSTHFAIFSNDKEFGQQAIPVKNWSSTRLIANTPSKADLKTEINGAKKGVALLIKDRSRVERLLNPLQDKATKIGHVDEIIDLELQLASLKQSLKDKDLLIKELESLTKRGRSLKDPENLNLTRSVLSEHLKKAAKITSTADRLERRKRQIATRTFKRKLKAIQEMEYSSTENMAREVLRLRKVRKDLEEQLNIAPLGLENPDF